MDDSVAPCVTKVGCAVAGSVDNGKSTLIGVLTNSKNELDDGNGSARLFVAKHPHEIESGKTSDISTRMFLCKETNSAVTLIDLCGHEKYLKTTAAGLSGHYPDYALMIIAANKGVLPMTKQHFTLLISLNIPICIIITRPDITPKDVHDSTKENLSLYCQKQLKTNVKFMNSYFDGDDLPTLHEKISAEILEMLSPKNGIQSVIPVLTVSNKTGYYVECAKQIMSKLTPRNFWKNFDYDTPDSFGVDEPTDQMKTRLGQHCTNRIIKGFISRAKDQSIFPQVTKFDGSIFYIDGVFTVPGVGLVVSGIARGKPISLTDSMYIGPVPGKDTFENEIRIRSFNNNIRQKVSQLDDHDRGCIAIAPMSKKDNVSREIIKRGMILISPKSLGENVCWRFNCVIMVFNHPATLKTNYCPNIHMGTIRQTARMTIDPLKNDGKTEIKSNEYAFATFKFRSCPEYVEQYQTFLFRSGTVHGIGVVVGVIPIDTEDKSIGPDIGKFRGRKSAGKKLPRRSEKPKNL